MDVRSAILDAYVMAMTLSLYMAVRFSFVLRRRLAQWLGAWRTFGCGAAWKQHGHRLLFIFGVIAYTTATGLTDLFFYRLRVAAPALATADSNAVLALKLGTLLALLAWIIGLDARRGAWPLVVLPILGAAGLALVLP